MGPSTAKTIAIGGLRVATLALAVGGAIGLSACGTPPRASNSSACVARSWIETAVGDLNKVDYSQLDAGQLHTALASLQQGVTEAKGAVALRQNSDLRKLGGLPYLQTVDNHLETLLGEASRAGSDPGSVDLQSLKADVAAQTREGQRIAGAIKGC